jgi:hypothetical protein
LNTLKFGIFAGLLAILAFTATTASATPVPTTREISVKQASLDDVQDACIDAGGTITGWHFIINQIRPITDAPDSIHVMFSDGSSEDVDFSKTSGPVAHYNVTATGTQTLVTGATADIYTAWSGQFNLSSVDCRPPLDACTAFPGRTVIVLNERLGQEGVADLVEMSGVIAVNIAAGEYTVTLGSFDDHATHGGQGQFFEQWYAVFTTANGPVETDEISDLPDALNDLNEVVGEINLTATATGIQAFHLLAGGVFNTPESIEATCVALDPVLD